MVKYIIMKFNFKQNEINYIKISCKNIDGASYNLRAGLKLINDREILACSKFEQGIDILTPQEVLLNIVCNDGIYKTKTILKSVENDEPYVFFALDTPQNIDYQQNREYFRVQIECPCVCKLNIENMTKEFSTKTLDLSANGVSIFSSNLQNLDKINEIHILTKNRNIIARVRYVRNEKFENGYKLSYAFLKMDENEQDYISQICLQKQIENKRNLLR